LSRRQFRATPGVGLRGIGTAAGGPSDGLPAARRVAVGVPLDLDHVGVVQQPVHGRRRDQVVEEERVPLLQRAVDSSGYESHL
jgi:hypothetical protein